MKMTEKIHCYSTQKLSNGNGKPLRFIAAVTGCCLRTFLLSNSKKIIVGNGSKILVELELLKKSYRVSIIGNKSCKTCVRDG
jgi:hypothetical protein